MKINNINIHNFRSIKDTIFHLDDYSVLIGANNQGKSNIIRALRVFYEYDKLKYSKIDDFPKFETDDRESWIEIEYCLTDDEYETLKEEYRLPENTLKVRKYLQSSAGLVKANQSNIYGYTLEGISDTLFYGAKNISQAKLGTVLYIPDVMTTEEAFKLKGPSPFRDVLNFVVGKVVKKSVSYSALQSSFQKFDEQFPHDKSADGHSVKGIQESLNENIREWDVEFNLHINPIDTDEIIKSLVTHSLTDSDLGKDVDIKHFGQGLQRHLIYTILKMSTEYVDEDEPKKKEFNPDFTLILFEEPEAFLHPSQQEILNTSLHTLSEIEGNQILVTTHSSTFVSKNIESLTSLIRVKRKGGISNIYQISDVEMDNLVLNNDGLYKHLEATYNDPNTPQEDKTALGGMLHSDTELIRLQKESIRYLLWLDTERCCSFFSDCVLICEGPTEKRFIDYMIQTGWNQEFGSKKVYVLESGGKYHMHKFMNLFSCLGIRHSVLFDLDNNKPQQKYINDYIIQSKNEQTYKIDSFKGDIESFLDVQKPSKMRNDLKPLNLMWKYHDGQIDKAKITQLKNKILALT